MSRELFDMDCLVQSMIELLKSSEQEALVPSIVKCLLALSDLNGLGGREP